MIVINNPSSFEVQALFLKFHLKLQTLGMKHSRLTKTELCNKCSEITGKKYSNRNLKEPLHDMSCIVEWAKRSEDNVA